MRKVFLALFLLPFLMLSAQGEVAKAAKVKPAQTETFNYQRCNLTVITLMGQPSSSSARPYYEQLDFSGKVDLNNIRTKTIRTSADYRAIQNELDAERVGRQILNYWLAYDGKKFSPALLEARAKYNAIDQDILNDAVSKVATTKNSGRLLMPNSYVVVLSGDGVNSKRNEKTGELRYEAKGTAYIYKVGFTDQLLEEVWQNWLDESSTAAERQAYEALEVPLSFVSSSTFSGTGKSSDEALKEAATKVLPALEERMPALQVASTIFSTHPITSKIGTKEGIRNSDRYRAYKVRELPDGTLQNVPVGYLRATTVADNSHDADGNSEASKFVQVSGPLMKTGYFLKEKKDHRIGLSLGANFMKAVGKGEIVVDYLFHTTHVLGISHYGFFGLGFDVQSSKRIAEAADQCVDPIYTTFDDVQKGPYTPTQVANEFNRGVSYMNAYIGYGAGLRFCPQLELMPYISVGGDYLMKGSVSIITPSSTEEEGKSSQYIAPLFNAGAKLSVNLWYPLQLYVKANYGAILGGGPYYRFYNDMLRGVGKGHSNGFSLGAGLKWTF